MKTKFTLLILASFLIVANTNAQTWGKGNDKDYAYENNFRYGNQNSFDYRGQLAFLQQKLNFETDILNRAIRFHDFYKIKIQRQKIAQIQTQIWQLNHSKRYDYDNYRGHDRDGWH